MTAPKSTGGDLERVPNVKWPCRDELAVMNRDLIELVMNLYDDKPFRLTIQFPLFRGAGGAL